MRATRWGLLALLLTGPGAGLAPARGADEPAAYDVVVYGGTSAGLGAAVQAKRMGKTVIVVGPDRHLGGLSSGGLGWTDSGRKEAVGGLARQFYHRIYLEYQKPDAWPWQPREAYGNKGQGTPAIDGVAGPIAFGKNHDAAGRTLAVTSIGDVP